VIENGVVKIGWVGLRTHEATFDGLNPFSAGVVDFEDRIKVRHG
jgi:hypothetical protein